jgi:putative sigma-54 modulation protein
LDVTVSSRHKQLPDNLRRVAAEKIGRLDRFLDGLERAEVHFFEQKNPRIAENQVCEVTLEGHGHHVRCKVAAPDGYVAVDRAVEKLEVQLQRLKTKLKAKPRRGAKVPPPDALVPVPDAVDGDGADGDGAEETSYDMPRVVKVKRFAMMPMTPEEAAVRMELVGHEFFMFTNLDTHRTAVVYRREDGDVGLIDEDG